MDGDDEPVTIPPMLYLDHAATTPMRPEAIEAMEPFHTDVFGNPSGSHRVSRRAKAALEDARERAAELLGGDHPLEVVFTGGGTESDNLALAGAALVAGARGGVVTTAVEHSAVLETARFLHRLGCPLKIVGVGGDGTVHADDITEAVDSGTAVVSVMAANNETGARMPVRKIADAVHAASGHALVHTDAVQAYPSEEISVSATGADMITVASHKIGGPKGVGLLWVRPGVELEPVIHGGGQELDRRSGTHNVAGIVGMVAAMEATVADRARFRSDVGEARRRFDEALLDAIPEVEVTAVSDRLVQHAHIRIPGVSAETLLIRLDTAGLAASAGSACQSGAVEVSHVLRAMGMSDVAASECIRVSFGWTTRPEDGDKAALGVAAEVASLR